MKNENHFLCGICQGSCCKTGPGAFLPEDFGKNIYEIKENIIFFLQKKDIVLSFLHIKKFGKIFFPIPNTKKNKKRIHPTSQGVCIFLTEKGCMLSYDQRPIQCKILTPRFKKNRIDCFYPNTFDGKYALRDNIVYAWIEYQDILLI